MPVQKVENSQFVYIIYNKQNNLDFPEFAKRLEETLSVPSLDKEIVMDFSLCASILLTEVSLATAAAARFKGTDRKIRLIANADIMPKIESMKIAQVPNVVVYRDRKAFFDSYIKIGASSSPDSDNLPPVKSDLPAPG